MKPTTFAVTLPNGLTVTRTSRTKSYTHVVVRNGDTFRVREGCNGVPKGWHVAHWCGRPDLAYKQADLGQGDLILPVEVPS